MHAGSARLPAAAADASVGCWCCSSPLACTDATTRAYMGSPLFKLPATLVRAEPLDACDEITNKAEVAGKVVLVQTGICGCVCSRMCAADACTLHRTAAAADADGAAHLHARRAVRAPRPATCWMRALRPSCSLTTTLARSRTRSAWAPPCLTSRHRYARVLGHRTCALAGAWPAALPTQPPTPAPCIPADVCHQLGDRQGAGGRPQAGPHQDHRCAEQAVPEP